MQGEEVRRPRYARCHRRALVVPGSVSLPSDKKYFFQRKQLSIMAYRKKFKKSFKKSFKKGKGKRLSRTYKMPRGGGRM